MFGLSPELSARVTDRLNNEQVIWLTTVRADGTPQPSPVWFLWDDDTFLIYSRPDTPKIRNIANNPTVALNLDSDGDGGDIVVFTGQAQIETDAPDMNTVAAYVAKYRQGMEDIGLPPETFGKTYSTVIRVRPVKVRAH